MTSLLWSAGSMALGVMVFFVAFPLVAEAMPFVGRLSPFPLISSVLTAALSESRVLSAAAVVTVQQFILAAVVGLLLGIALSIAFALSRPLRLLFGPWVRVLQITPAIIWIPFLMRAPVLSTTPFLVPSALGAAFAASYVFVHVSQSIMKAELGESTYAAAQKAGWRWRLRFMYWPRILQGVISSMQIGGSVALILVVVGDALLSTEGLGHLIQGYQTSYAADEVAAVFVVLAVLALAYGALSHGVDRLVWRPKR